MAAARSRRPSSAIATLALLLAAAALAPPRAAAAQAAADAADSADSADVAAASAALDAADLLDASEWEIPDMQAALRAAWSDSDAADDFAVRVASMTSLDASGGCGAKAAVAEASCPPLVSPEFGWWTGNADRRNAFLMSVLVRDNYPMKHNLGADGDDTTQKRALWQCLLRQKWRALGADRVEFYESSLNNVVVIKAGNNVYANMRGTWTQAHRDSNMEWRLGPKKKIWGVGVRYHTGWGKTAEDSYAAIKSIVRDFNIPQSECKLWLSGHSRGGGAALLTAAFADGRDGAAAPCKVAGVWTFGSVKPYDADFVRAYNANLGSKTWNWWNQIDVVPTLPPGIAGYGAQIPRLRLGANYTCPAAPSLASCIKVGAKTACPKRGNGALNHHDYEYSAGLARCSAATLGLSQDCVAALAPPYRPPTAKELRAQKKADRQAARATARAAKAGGGGGGGGNAGDDADGEDGKVAAAALEESAGW